jgi:putative phosphoesterase
MILEVISDIHGNVEALKAVLSEIDKSNKIVCCGDIVGYGPKPQECVDIVRREADIFVQGNHDKYVSDPNNYHNPVVVDGLRHAQKELSHYQIRWLQNLQITQEISNYIITHSHPIELEKRMKPNKMSKPPNFAQGYKGLVFGHTHKQHNLNVGGLHITNPGSVGQPRDSDYRAAYATINTDKGTAELHRVDYDIEKTIQDVKDADLSDRIIDRLRKGE